MGAARRGERLLRSSARICALLTAALAGGLAVRGLEAKGGKPKEGATGWPAIFRPSAEQVQALVRGLSASDAQERERAVAELVRAGPGALRPLLIELPLKGGEASETALLRGLEGWGPDVALGTLLAERSTYAYRFEPEVKPVLERLRKRRPPERTRSLVLQPGVLDDPDLLPPVLVVKIEEALRLPGLDAAVPARSTEGELLLDVAADGRFATRIQAGKPARLALAAAGRPRTVLVWRRLDAWYAGPADLRSGPWGKEQVALLDTDGDGRFDGGGDAIRFGDGAFRPLEDGNLAWTDGTIVRFQARDDAAGARMEGADEPWPPGVPEPVRQGVAAINLWRRAVGLLPKFVDWPHSEQCQAHVEYWRQNGFTGHSEDPSKPGYTEEGAEAGRSSTCWPVLGPADTVRTITATVMHRVNTLTAWHEGYGVGTGAGSCLWGGSVDTSQARYPVVAPGPGQRDVPTTVSAELPEPQGRSGFYRTPHGYPVSLLWSRRVSAWASPRIEVFALGPKPAPLAGITFAPQSAYLERDPTNDDAIVFVPVNALAAKQAYLARVTASDGGTPLRFEWVFRTR